MFLFAIAAVLVGVILVLAAQGIPVSPPSKRLTAAAVGVVILGAAAISVASSSDRQWWQVHKATGLRDSSTGTLLVDVWLEDWPALTGDSPAFTVELWDGRGERARAAVSFAPDGRLAGFVLVGGGADRPLVDARYLGRAHVRVRIPLRLVPKGVCCWRIWPENPRGRGGPYVPSRPQPFLPAE